MRLPISIYKDNKYNYPACHYLVLCYSLLRNLYKVYGVIFQEHLYLNSMKILEQFA